MLARIVIAFKARSFRENEDGLALTEYLLLLGLITAGIITAVLGFGNSLESMWTQWSDFMATFDEQVDIPVDLNGGEESAEPES